MIDESQWEWFGNAGHFIFGHKCRFHLCTKVGDYLVSTVGEYLPDSGVREILAKSRGVTLTGQGDERERSWMKQCGFEEIGCDRKYETMVFRAGRRCNEPTCDCRMPGLDDPTELDFQGYNRAGDATRGHLAMCEKWAAVTEPLPVG